MKLGFIGQQVEFWHNMKCELNDGLWNRMVMWVGQCPHWQSATSWMLLWQPNCIPACFIFFTPCMFLQSTYQQSTDALHNMTHMTYFNCCILWHRVPSSGSYYKHRCTSQPAIIYFFHSYEHNYVWLWKCIKLLKHAKLLVMMIYGIVVYYNILIISGVVCQFLVSLRNILVVVCGLYKHWLWFCMIQNDFVL